MKKITGAFAILLLFISNAEAVGVGVKAGTIGFGIEVSVPLTNTINARVSLTTIDIDDQEETIEVGDEGATGDMDAVLGLDFGATALLFDWYIFDGSFHLTAGMMKNDSELSFTGALQDGIVVDGEPLDPSDINGDVSGEVSLGESFQPYVGIGWGRRAGDEGGLAFTAELGVALLDPSANLDAAVNVTGTNNLDQAELDDRIRGVEADAETELDEFEAWPVLTLGLNYNF